MTLNDVTISDYQATFCKVSIPRTQGKKGPKEALHCDEVITARKKSHIELLRELLWNGVKNRKNKGWHRRELNLNSQLSEKGRKKSPHCSNDEMFQLMHEYEILVAFNSGTKKIFGDEKKWADKEKKEQAQS